MLVLIGYYLFSIILMGFLMYLFTDFKIKDFLIIAIAMFLLYFGVYLMTGGY